jgi:endonuclease YncB( thermonuclease family)
VEELQNLLGSISPQHAIILVDCFSVDLFDRLSVDVRGIYPEDQLAMENLPLPSLDRFELAQRALSSGYAFPTYNYLITDNLLAAFAQARQQKRGAFEANGPVFHPSVCRRNRYKVVKDVTRARRGPYNE